MQKTERLIDLLMLLLDTPRGLTAAEIRERNPGYGQDADDSFHRMFERDKAELRALGFPIEQEDTLALGPTYRIRPTEALLEDPGLTPAEQAALALASLAWHGGRDPSAAAMGTLKLAAFGDGSSPGAPWLLPRVTMAHEIATLSDAIARRKRVTFAYRSGGGGEPETRTVEPHGLVHTAAWYLWGHDLARGDRRSFKLSRIEGAVTVAPGDEPDFDEPPRDLGRPRAPWEGEGGVEAIVVFSPDAAWRVERLGRGARGDEGAAGVPFTFEVSDLDSFASWVAGFGADAHVEGPPALRDAVIARLRSVVEG